jgi:nicotinate-nucleotide pyrophosphorylase
VVVECAGKITPENVREYAEAGAQLISIQSLTNAPATDITFKIQPF